MACWRTVWRSAPTSSACDWRLAHSPNAVLRLLLHPGLRLALTGVGMGLASAVVAVRALYSVRFEISPWDPVARVTSAGVLLAVSLLASRIPARNALRVDPVIALRG